MIADLKNLNTWKPYLEAQKKLYRDTSIKRWDARERIAMTRIAYAKEASATLKATLKDLLVTLKFSRSAYSPDAENYIKTAMAWRTVQVPRAALLISHLSMPGLIKAIEERNSTAIMSVVTSEKVPVFDKNEAERIIAELSKPAARFALERFDVFDLPNLIITKIIVDAAGKSNYLNRDFSKLSLGQQQSVLLALMLASKSNSPLIIDQPEDNLDGEFIYQSIVPILRLAKERRQIIVVTHNANIAILGDAEQIIVLKSTNEKCSIVAIVTSIENCRIEPF
jgi:hypothetical protein